VRNYQNERGPGKIASLTLIDGSGSMKCVMFGETVDKFYNQMEVGKIYKISNGQIKPARQSQYEASLSEFDVSDFMERR
jgi:replication factor A1